MGIANCPDGGHCQNDYVIEVLLAAGQAALSYLSDQDARDDMSDAGFIRYDDVVDALRAAIAAARGTTEEVT